MSLFTDRELMKVIHRKGSHYLFNNDSKPVVVKRWTSRKKENHGEVMELRFPLDSESMDQETRSEMRKAWAEQFNLQGAIDGNAR